MSMPIEFHALSLVEPEPTPKAAATPAALAEGDAGRPVTGRRWSDGAGIHAPTDPNAPWSMAQQWPHLVAALSEQAVESSNLLLRALNYLVGAGRLRRSEAKALSDAMHQLRDTSLRAQQITRLAGGRIRQAREHVDLAELVRRVLEDRDSEITAAGATASCIPQPVDVLLDTPVAISLINSTIDWALSFSRDIQFRLQPSDESEPARLKVRVATPPPATAAGAAGFGGSPRPRGRRLNDGLHWMLLRQIAASSGLEVTRSREEGAAMLTIAFPHSFVSSEGLACLDMTDPDDRAAAVRETWVLVVAGDDDLRQEAVQALRKMGIAAVGAADAAQARAAAAERQPHVLVTGYDIPVEAVGALRREALGGEERCPLVEITREAPCFQVSGFDRFETAKVGREQITAELPATVLFELVKQA